MNTTSFRLILFLMTLATFTISTDTCNADLFALMTGNGGIVRMDSTTGAVIDTYAIEPFVTFPGSPQVDSGLAFDGRNLYVDIIQNIPGFEEIWMFNLATETWQPSAILETFFLDPPIGKRISGLGYTTGTFGDPTLVAVTRREPNSAPGFILEYPLTPPFFPSIPIQPAGELPADIDAQGVDVDAATGEIWIAGEQVQGTNRTAILLRAELDGTILETLTPAIGPAVIPRGLAFDNGQMFIGARNLPNVSNEVYRIDPATGAVLTSFVITGGTTPSGGVIAALTGGTVVPEPTTGALCLVIAGFMASRVGRSDRRRE
jgi:hypothetical protein